MKSQIKRIGTVLGLPAEIIAHPGVLQLVQAVVAERCKPLTDEQIKQIVGASDTYWATSQTFILAIARAVEAAITKEQT